MARRYRFYCWSAGNVAFAKLRQRLAEDLYTEEAGQGFRILQATKQEIEGRFVQRVAYTEEVVSPDGSLTHADRVNYVHTAFRLRPESCGLMLIEPPRSTSAFLYRLSHLLNYEVSVEPTVLSLITLKRSLQAALGRARVTSVKINGAVLAENVLADICVTDPRDALESALVMFPQHRKCIGRLEMAFGEDSRGIRVSATRAGTIATNDSREAVLETLWEAVSAASA